MKPIFWGVIVFLLTIAVAATPASGGEVYASAAAINGAATYMALNPDGTFAEQVDMQLSISCVGICRSYGNGIGDFDNDGDLDYISAVGYMTGDIYIFPKFGLGNQFDPAVWVGDWADGWWPADMAVADFNGDGNLDFVLNYMYSPDCGLYLGDGNLGFTRTILANTTPQPSVGVDAADFNNDGIADFVVAPNPSEPFRVHMGKPDGTFYEAVSSGKPVSGLAGIAAGDFVKDSNGYVDLAVSSNQVLEIYTGNGDGTFVLFKTYDLPVNASPLDNGDFNGDGNEDLVAADFGTDPEDHAGVAVLLGDGNGDFLHSNTYLGGVPGGRRAVAVPYPYPYQSNKEPVARLTPEIINVTVGETVEWDASESYDEDGTISGYEWDYGDGTVSPSVMGISTLAKSGTDGNSSGGAKSSYAYFDTGTYYVTLTVIDDLGATGTVQAEVHVEALPVTVYFSPRRLNLKSKGKWITATLRVPPGYDVRMIDPDSLFLVVEGKPAIKAHSVYRHRNYFSKYYKKKHRRLRKLTVKFDRQALIRALDGIAGNITLTVSGDILSDGNPLVFSGTGNIKAYEKKEKISSFKKYLMQQIMRFFS